MNRITDPRQYGCTELTVISQLSHMSHIWVNFIHTAVQPDYLCYCSSGICVDHHILQPRWQQCGIHTARLHMSDMKEVGQANGGDGNTWMDKLSHGKGMQLQNPLFSLHIVDSILTIKRKPMLQHQTSYLDSSKMVLQGLWHIRVVCEWVSRLEWKDLGRW